MSEINGIKDITSEEIKKPTGNEIEKIAKIDIDGDKPKGEEIPDELKKESAENKEVENYSDSIGEKFMIGINEHPITSAGIQSAGELSGIGNEYLQQHIDIRTEIVEKSKQEIGMSQIENNFGVKFDFDNANN